MIKSGARLNSLIRLPLRHMLKKNNAEIRRAEQPVMAVFVVKSSPRDNKSMVGMNRGQPVLLMIRNAVTSHL